MERPKFFKQTTIPQIDNPIDMGKFLKKITLIIVSLALIAHTTFSVFVIAKQTSTNWQEIWFAYNKPNVVKMVREDYQRKQANLDQELLNKDSMNKQIGEAVKKAVKEEVKSQNSFR